MFRRRNNKEQEQKDVLEKEVTFWKTEMEKVVNEKNVWVERYMKASEDNEMLRAELFLVQQDAQSTRAQLEVLRVREECRVAHSPAVGVGSSTGTPQSGRAGFAAAGLAACGSFGPSATSVNTSPIKGAMLLRSGGGRASVGVISPCDRSTVQQLEEQVADLKAELNRANRQVAAAEAAAHAADMRVALLEERLLEAGQELEAARRQTEFMRATAEAHQREANALRAEVLSQRSINDETANETTKILSELSSAQQRCAKLASELSIKEQMVGLLQLQLGDFAAAAAAPGVNSSTAGLALPLAAAAAVAPSSSRPSRSVSLSSSGWGLGQLPPSGRTSSGLGCNGDSTVPVADSEPVVEVQRERSAAVPAGGGGVNGVEWAPKVLDSPEDGGKSPSLGIANGGDGRGGGGSRGGCNAIAGAGGSIWAAAAAAAAAALGSFPASIASSASEPIVCIGSSTGGTPSPIGAGDSSKANCEASAAVMAADTSDVVLSAANTVYTANGDSRAATEVQLEARLAVPSLADVAAPSGTAPPSATATTPSAAVAAAEAAGPTFQEAAMQVDPTPSHQPPAILRKSLSKGFAAATAAATAGSPQVQPLRPHLHYHQQRPANVPQLQLGSALRGRDGGVAADASAATPTAADSSTTGVSVSTSPATMVGKRVAAEKPKGDEGEPPAPKRMSAIGMASTAMVTAASQLSNALTVAAAIEEASQEATGAAVAASAVVVAEATATADVAVTVIVDGGEQKQVPSGVDEPKQDLVSVASSGNVVAAAAAEVAKEEAENLEKEAEKKRTEEEAQIVVQRPATDSFASSKSGTMLNGSGNDARAGEPSKSILDTAVTLTPPSSSKPSGSDPTVDTEVAAAGGAVKTGGGPAVLAPRAFRFPGNRAAAAAAAASLAPPKALNTAATATNATSSASTTEGIPRTPFGFAARRSSGGAGGSDCGATPPTAAATSTPPPVSAVEPVAAAGTPGGANGAAGTASASRGGVSSTLSLLKRFNSGGLGSEPSRDKSPAPAVVAAAEGPSAGSGLSAVAAAVRRISAGVSDGAATLLAAQDSGTLNSAMQPSTQSSQLTPPKRPTGTGVSTLLNKFNSVSNAGTPPTPPPAPGSVSATAGNGSGSTTMVVPEYCIGGPATRVPASAKIAAMRSAYEKNKS